MSEFIFDPMIVCKCVFVTLGFLLFFFDFPVPSMAFGWTSDSNGEIKAIRYGCPYDINFAVSSFTVLFSYNFSVTS